MNIRSTQTDHHVAIAFGPRGGTRMAVQLTNAEAMALRDHLNKLFPPTLPGALSDIGRASLAVEHARTMEYR